MYKIRPLTLADSNASEKICIETAAPFFLSSEERTRAMLIIYNRWYLRQNPCHCFGAVDESGALAGYILCAPDYNEYKKSFCAEELKELRRISLSSFFAGLSEIKGQKSFSYHYPAHLHIDILPKYQGKGVGTALMKTLLFHLKEIGVPGVKLIVAADNKKAIRFYEKCGFSIIAKRPYTMAQKL